MKKQNIAHRIHQAVGISEKDAATLLDWFFELLKTTLQQGESISISNFGSFTVRRRNPRLGRNPQTGKPIMIASRRVVVFHASLDSKLKSMVSKQSRKRQKTSCGDRKSTRLNSSHGYISYAVFCL